MTRRPTRKQSTVVAPAVFIIFFAFIAIVFFCPVTSAQNVPSEYGTIIGIGMHFVVGPVFSDS